MYWLSTVVSLVVITSANTDPEIAVDHAMAARNQGRVELALEEARRAEKLAAWVSAPAPVRARIENALALLARDRFDWPTAEAHFLRAAELAGNSAEHCRLAAIIAFNRAETYLQTGRMAAAQSLLAQGSNHASHCSIEPHTAALFNQIRAQFAKRKGDLRSAGRLMKAVVQTLTRALGPEHHDSLVALNNLAQIQADLGDTATAIRSLERVVSGFRRTVGSDHPRTASALANLGGALYLRKEFAAAEKHFREALRINTLRLGPAARETSDALQLTALSVLMQGRATEAIELAGDAVRRTGHNVDAHATLASIHLELRNYDAASAVFARIREMLRAGLPARPDVMRLLESYSAALRERKEHAAAELFQAEAVRLRTRQAVQSERWERSFR